VAADSQLTDRLQIVNTRKEIQLVTPQVLGYIALIGTSVILAVAGLATDFLFPIAAIIALVFGIWVVKRPFTGFLMYVMMVYLRPADLVPALATAKVQFILLGLLIALWVFDQFIIRKEKFFIEPIDTAIMVFFVVMCISVGTSVFISHSMNYIGDFFRFLIFWLLASQILRTERHVKLFTWMVIGCVAFVAFVQIWTYLTIGLNRTTGLGGYGIHIGPLNLDTSSPINYGVEENVHGVGGYSAGFLANASELGLAVLAMLPFIYYLLPTLKQGWHKAGAIGLLLMYFVSIVVCGARGAFVGTLVVLMVIFWRSSRKALIALCVLGVTVITIPMLPAQYIDRIASTSKFEEDESANIRLTLWTAGLHMIMDRPIIGVGVGCFSQAYGMKYRPPDQPPQWWEPHNIFVQVTSELGFIGLAVFLWLLFLTFRENRRSREKLEAHGEADSFFYNLTHGIDVGLIGYLVSGCFITSLYYPHPYLMALLARSVSVIIRKRYADAEKAEQALVPTAVPLEGQI
jgi:putative inorganic carbon (hco3(-)) transporter